MTYTITTTVNNAVTVTVQGTATGLPIPPDLTLTLNGAVVASPAITFAAVSSSVPLYNFTYTPTSTGTYVLYAFGSIQCILIVVTQDLYSMCKNIQDEALGSWQWDKVGGTLTMLRQDGTTLATFAVVDNLTTSSRERTS
jgi:hypothetical protein